ncbi:molybdenum cofactor guanylyltransferase [Isoptericola sp. NPDC055881]
MTSASGPTREPPGSYDAVVLAGGRATRLGGVPKPTVVLDGDTLLDRALAATRDAEHTVVVGPDLPLPPGRDVIVAREDPPFGGPVAGLDAGLRALERARRHEHPAGRRQADGAAPAWVLVLAVDVPRAAEAVPLLRAAVTHAAQAAVDPGTSAIDGAYLVRDGRAQWLVGLYRHEALRGALDALAGTDGLSGLPVRRLVGLLRCVEVPDAEAVSADVDTWDDVRRLTVGLHDVVAEPAATATASEHAPPQERA